MPFVSRNKIRLQKLSRDSWLGKKLDGSRLAPLVNPILPLSKTRGAPFRTT